MRDAILLEGAEWEDKFADNFWGPGASLRSKGKIHLQMKATWDKLGEVTESMRTQLTSYDKEKRRKMRERKKSATEEGAAVGDGACTGGEGQQGADQSQA